MPIKTTKSQKKNAPKKGAGGKLNRSEIVQTRLTPKFRFYAELMARHQRRSLSSLIEGLVEKIAPEYEVPILISEETQMGNHLFGERHYKNMPLKQAGLRLWSPEEADRFAAIALHAPDLLTPDEEQVWQLVVENPFFWENIEIQVENKEGQPIDKEYMPLINHRGLVRERFRAAWPFLSDILQGRDPKKGFKALKYAELRVVEKPDYVKFSIKKRR